jgi:hypothetical protein
MWNEEVNESGGDVMNKVQSELDLRRSSTVLDNSVEESPDKASRHPIAQCCDETLKDIRQVVGITNRESDIYVGIKSGTRYMSAVVDEELLQSYHDMKDFHCRLRDRIRKEQQRLACLQNSLDEHLEINRALDKLKPRTETTTFGTNRDQLLCGDGVNNESSQLHGDLLYITNCVEENFPDQQEDLPNEQSQYKRLYTLIHRCINQRIDCPDQPFLDLNLLTTEFHPKQIELLQEALILESNQHNSNQVALVDYT